MGLYAQNDLKQLPKVELHLHLDCSLSYDLVKKLRPAITKAEYESAFIAPPKCTDLADYISRAVKGIELMQNEYEIREVTLDLFRQLKADHVIYAEIRFAPLQHLQKGLNAEKVVQVVNDAVEEGIQTFGIQAGIILCTLRHYNEEQSMQTVELVKKFQGTHVIGFDIAADEAGFPIDQHKNAFAFAKTNHLHCTAHAGEAKGPASVWETLKYFQPERIGHGVRSAEDIKLIEHLKKNDIHLEVCPTSNIQTNVFGKMEDHCIDKLYKWGVSFSINTDARTISPITLASEYGILQQYFKWDIQQLGKCNLEAIRHAFTDDVTKQKLSLIVRKAYNID